jgi:hypothetical protein
MIAKIEVKDYDVKESSEILSTKKLTKKTEKALFHLNQCKLNPGYYDGLKTIPDCRPSVKERVKQGTPFDACLIGSNDTQRLVIKTVPKWVTTLGYYDVDCETGEILGRGLYETNEFKKSNGKKIKVMDVFADHYNDLYRKGKISVLFHTFTRPNHARMSFRRMLHLARKRYKKLGFNINGFVWTAEVTDETESKGKGLMWHYHLGVALDKRMNIKGKGIPKELKFEDLWGQRTEVEFVKKNIRFYMAKYFAKHNARVIGTRSYGRSKHFMSSVEARNK